MRLHYTILLLVAASAVASAQDSGLSANAWTGAGLDGPLDALGYEVTGTPVLAGAELAYRLPIAAGLSGGLGLGGMYVRRAGSLDGEDFAATAWRLTVAPDIGYRAGERLGLRAGVEVRSAADLAAFDPRLEDNVRTHVRLGGDYRLGARLSLTAAVSRLLGATADVANLSDPGRTVRLGLRHVLSGAPDRL